MAIQSASIPTVSDHWVTQMMEPSKNAHETRRFLKKACDTSQNQTSFVKRHFQTGGYSTLAWISAIFDSFTFSGKVLKNSLICVLEWNFEEALECVVMDSLDTLQSLKLAVFMPSFIFAGIFFPTEIFSRMDYPDIEAQRRRDLELQMRQRIEPPFTFEIAQQNARIQELTTENLQLISQNAEYARVRDGLSDLTRRLYTERQQQENAIHTQNGRILELTVQVVNLGRENEPLRVKANLADQAIKARKNLVALHNRRDAFFRHIIYQEIIKSPIPLLQYFHLCNSGYNYCPDNKTEFTVQSWNKIKEDYGYLTNLEGFKKLDFEALEERHPLEE